MSAAFQFAVHNCNNVILRQLLNFQIGSLLSRNTCKLVAIATEATSNLPEMCQEMLMSPANDVEFHVCSMLC